FRPAREFCDRFAVGRLFLAAAGSFSWPKPGKDLLFCPNDYTIYRTGDADENQNQGIDQAA
ncbi:MAG TPA: hypothetical protein VF451_01355, partial [Acidobacteriota bacterium]